MKKLILLPMLLLFGCSNSNYKTVEPIYMGDKIDGCAGMDDVDLKLYLIDSCEYIGDVSGRYKDFLTHKGNCKNPIHKK